MIEIDVNPAVLTNAIRPKGNPPKRKHWVLSSDKMIVAVPTIASSGNLYLNRELDVRLRPIKDGAFRITCGFTGLAITTFYTRMIAVNFVLRFGLVWESIYHKTIERRDGPIEAQRVIDLFGRIVRLYKHSDLGEDDGGRVYALENLETVRIHLHGFTSHTCNDTGCIGAYEDVHVNVHTPCAVTQDNAIIVAGYRIMRHSMFLPNSKQRVWLRFDHGTVHEFSRLTDALRSTT